MDLKACVTSFPITEAGQRVTQPICCRWALTSVFQVHCPNGFSQLLPQRSHCHLIPQCPQMRTLKPENYFSKVTHWQSQDVLLLSAPTTRILLAELGSHSPRPPVQCHPSLPHNLGKLLVFLFLPL